ncbi:hypothetical protein GUJ93_ZPchr0006g40753 [Zizania palustris]|uniref:Uncharacterized protein n=1 Tax=Zizania palustris TaxID=103762 RepID=A0A8J5T6V3_ZIZPA|nr:hypothetical protein GUJ93_ZPchr0006g40753 [Zizania palustris]
MELANIKQSGVCSGSSMARQLQVVALLLLLKAAAAAAASSSSTVVAGMVFCDQCKDGARGLFDYPLFGARVAIQCGGGDTPLTVRECNTNWFGGFSVRLEGSPDMNRCTARVVQATGHCGAATPGAPRELTLAFRMLGLALYTVPPLLSQPLHAMDFCPAAPAPAPPAPAAATADALALAPASSSSSSPPLTPPLVSSPAPHLPPPVSSPAPHLPPPVSSPAPPLPPFWRRRQPRHLPPVWRRVPTLPQPKHDVQPLPPPPPPSQPALATTGSACTYDKWALNWCGWRVVTPNTTVAMAFGPAAAQRYGLEMTLREALEGRGDMYRTLLREATAALLNTYYNAPGNGGFLYPTTASVIDHMNAALLGSEQRILLEGARFRRANSGGGRATKLPCDLPPCN